MHRAERRREERSGGPRRQLVGEKRAGCAVRAGRNFLANATGRTPTSGAAECSGPCNAPGELCVGDRMDHRGRCLQATTSFLVAVSPSLSMTSGGQVRRRRRRRRRARREWVASRAPTALGAPHARRAHNIGCGHRGVASAPPGSSVGVRRTSSYLLLSHFLLNGSEILLDRGTRGGRRC